MKRVVVVLALALMLVAFGWDRVIAADIYDDPNGTGDDHPWGSEVPSEDPGQYRHTRSDCYLSGFVTVDILLLSTGLVDEFDEIFYEPVNWTDEIKKERDCYIGHTKQQPLD
ncbi:MAG: hypothetical protein JSV52_08905 [Candidatus Zixiibacteriota bacterium]|nr:MAG: hypothetical protein JSV52_08905 [candidate division Zixibacteria bacterium]